MLQHVSVLAVERMLSSSVAIPVEMLEAVRARLRVQRNPDADFSLEVLSQRSGTLSVLGGLKLIADRSLDDVASTSLIVVPALWRNPVSQIAGLDETVQWINRQYHQGASVIAVGTGAYLLAESGILDGKAATTHWAYQKHFAQRYPHIWLRPNHLLTQSDRVYCAASVNSGADMVVHLISQMYGREMALQIEQQFSPEVRNPFDKNVFSPDPSRQHSDEDIALAQAWLAQNLREPFQLSVMADRAGMSERQFSRRFKAATAQTPLEYQQQLRCSTARDLLQQTNLSIADIGAAVGFSDSSYFIRLFRRLSGQTPGEFRQKVRSKLFTQTVL